MSFFRKLRSTLSNSRRAERGVLNPVYRNDGSEDVSFTPIDQTHVKTPFHSDNPQPGPSTEVPQSEKQQPRTIFSWLTFALFTILILGAITAIVIVITALRDPTRPGKKIDAKSTFVCNSPVQIPLQSNISFNCSFSGYQLKGVTIQVSFLGNNSVNLTLEKPTQIQWSMIQTSNSSVQIWGPQMLCDSSRMYQLYIITAGAINTTENISITTPSNSTEVNLKIDRATSCTTNDDVSDFYVSCSAQSGCEQSSLRFLAIRGTEATYNLELPFTCSNNYTNAHGWYVNCSGMLDGVLAKTIHGIKCHPSSAHLNESRMFIPQCNLTDRCTAKGVNLGENIIIVCNTTFNATNVDKIISPYNKTLEKSEWNVNYTANNITLHGPKANCSSAGEYMITTSNNGTNSSRVQRVTLEILEKTDFNESPNCSACESYPKCQRSYTLRMDPSDASSENSFSSNCTTKYSDSSGSITRCVIPSHWNVTVTCTLFDSKTIKTRNVPACT